MGRKFGVRWKYANAEEAQAAKKAQEAIWNAKQRDMRAAERQKRLDPIPIETAHERERAMMAPRTIGQELCGEPLKGRSALDRMRAEA